MWPDNRLTELLGIEHPIIQAPMAGHSTPAMASAVCEAGGLGSLASAGMSPAALRETLGRLTNDRVHDHYLHNGEWRYIEGYAPDIFFNAAANFIKGRDSRKPFFIYLNTKTPGSQVPGL